MHKSWLDQLPYYAAGTLPETERAALEQHLAGCGDCRRTLAEWRTINHAVTDTAAARARYLPPLRALPPRLTPRRRITRRAAAWAASILIALAAGLIAGLGLDRSGASGTYGSLFIQATDQATELPVFTPTPVAISLPLAVQLDGIRYEAQTWNNDGPATLSMALSLYGVSQDQNDIQSVLRPNTEDKSVRPVELVQYVGGHTGLRALARTGSDQAVLKRLLAAGFPVIVEQGFTPAGEDWLGHYVLVMGYDDAVSAFLTYDSYLGHGNMQGLPQSYGGFDAAWRQFNRVFIVVYDPVQEAALQLVLGDYADEDYGTRMALDAAQREVEANNADGFAWFSLGTAYVALRDYENAAATYDKAFELDLPWRMLWYQFGPYVAYYQVGRYEDILALAETTLATTTDVEETYYWQGMAYAAEGRDQEAEASFKEALRLNPNFAAALVGLARLQGPPTQDVTEAPDVTETASP